MTQWNYMYLPCFQVNPRDGDKFPTLTVVSGWT